MASTTSTIIRATCSKQQDLQSPLPSSQALDLSSAVSLSSTTTTTSAKGKGKVKDDSDSDEHDMDDDDQEDSDTMSRAVDDVMAYVDHLTFSSRKNARLPLPFTPERSSMDSIGNETDVNVITSIHDRAHHHHPTTISNKMKTMTRTMTTTTSALLDRTNTLFPDMTPFHKRKNPNADAYNPRSPMNMNIRRRPLSPLSPAAMEPLTTIAATSVTTAAEIPSECERLQEGEPSESASTTTTTSTTTPAPDANETESEKSSQDESESESETTNIPIRMTAQASASAPAPGQVQPQPQAPAPHTDSYPYIYPYQCQCQNKCRYEQQAWEEREKARNWARDLRTSVQHWVQQQKECLATERDQAQPTQAIIPRYQAAIETKEQEVRNLHRELQQSRQHHQSVEQQLYEVIQYQHDRLQQAELEAKKQQQQQQQQPAMMTRMTEEPTIPSKSVASSSSSSSSSATATATGNGMSTPHQVAISPEAAPMPRTTTVVPPVIDTSVTPRSRLRRRSKDGTQFVTYGNGSTKEIHVNGTTVIRYPNGDVKTYSADNGGTIAYHYAASKVTEVRKDNDTSNTIFEFPNGQVEQHWNDGRKIVSFPDGTTQRVAPDGSAETVLAEHPSSVHVEHSNGQQEWLHVATN